MTPRQPILSQTCAVAATAEESRFRIDAPEPASRASRIIALDAAASSIVERLEDRRWQGSHFLIYQSTADAGDDAVLVTTSGDLANLSDEVSEADVVVMIATSETEPAAAALIGDHCADRGVMSAALVVAQEDEAEATISALRPNAMVLAILKDERDIRDLLTALRA